MINSLKDLLNKDNLYACEESIIWLENKTIEEVINDCDRGDWLLWLGFKLNLPIKTMTLAKARCAKLVIHLIKDQKSINAINTAEKYGLGKCTLKELKSKIKPAYQAIWDEIGKTGYNNLPYVDAAYCAININAFTIREVVNAVPKPRYNKKAAVICKEILGELIINKVNKLLNKQIYD